MRGGGGVRSGASVSVYTGISQSRAMRAARGQGRGSSGEKARRGKGRGEERKYIQYE